MRLPGGQEIVDMVAADWLRNQITLNIIAARTLQKLNLGLRLDPFGDGLQPQPGRQADGAVKNMTGEGVGADHGDEALIDQF